MELRTSSQPAYLTTLEHDGKRLSVNVRTSFDGVEYVGRLYFSEEGWEDSGFPDRGALPGRTRDEVMAQAHRLTPQELLLRYRRALAEKRRYTGLRRLTDDILAKVRYLNQLAISMRAGLLDVEGASQEIDLTERQLHELIDKLRLSAGVEENDNR